MNANDQAMISNGTTLPATIDQNALARLREKAKLEATIEAWKPKPGDVLEGAIIGARDADGPFGPQRQGLVQTPKGTMVAIRNESFGV